MLPAPFTNHGRKPAHCHGFSDHVCTLQQYSEGNISIKSSNPHEAPEIDPKCLTHPDDMPGLVKAFKQTREIFQHEVLNEYSGIELRPGIEVDDDDKIEQWLRNEGLETLYHPVSSCRIGINDDDPLDHKFNVKGVQGTILPYN